MSSNIQWTDKTWNVSTGCTKVSAGCKHCYAEVMAKRLENMGQARYANGFAYTQQADILERPKQWKRPKKIFVNSMSDLFHEQADEAFLARVFGVMMETSQHTYQVLTKRPERMATILTRFVDKGIYTPSSHIWLGTSVESALVLERIEHLRQTPTHIRFLSCEPSLGDLGTLPLEQIDWVIAGGESGPHLWDKDTRQTRALVEYQDKSWQPKQESIRWLRHIRDQCVESNVAFFFKQWGGATNKAAGDLLDGQQWHQFPQV